MALRQSTTSRAFSLIELLVVLSVVLVLATLLFSALSTAKNKAQQIQCLNNLRQIEITRQLYSFDNNKIVANGLIVDANNPSEIFWVQGHQNNGISRDLTNSALLFNREFALFADYLPKSKIYKCPSDRERFKLNGIEKTAEKVRTYGLNWHLGLVRPDFSVRERDILKKEEDIISPVNTLTFVDVNSQSVCWPVFGIFPEKFIFMYPSSIHNKGANLAFADGRVERKKWTDENTNPATLLWHSHWEKTANNKDFEWLISKRGVDDGF